MMPLAPHMSPPSADCNDMSITATRHMSSNHKPKLAFSIDSIVNNNHKTKSFGAERPSSPSLPNRQSGAKRSRLSSRTPSPLPPVVTSNSSPGAISNTSSSSPSLAPVSQALINGQYQSPSTLQHYPGLIHHPNAVSIGGHSTPHPLMMAAMAANHMSAAGSVPLNQGPHGYHQAMAMMANPWLMRANQLAFNRFHGMPFDGAFLLPPFRKAKRVRTAFSPGQLLKLEHAFERNHYVVGQERKQLATSLGLSETQVKVWFQNRRTKHKRQKTDGEDDGEAGGAGSPTGCAGDKTDDEEIEDLDDDNDSDLDIDVADDDNNVMFRQSLPSLSTGARFWPYVGAGHHMMATDTQPPVPSISRY